MITPLHGAPPVSKEQTAKPSLPDQSEKHLRDVSVRLEASFLSEMLKSAGLGARGGSFGGGAGEDQFSSFLREAQAQRMAEAGGIGLAEGIFQSLKARTDGLK